MTPRVDCIEQSGQTPDRSPQEPFILKVSTIHYPYDWPLIKLYSYKWRLE